MNASNFPDDAEHGGILSVHLANDFEYLTQLLVNSNGAAWLRIKYDYKFSQWKKLC